MVLFLNASTRGRQSGALYVHYFAYPDNDWWHYLKKERHGFKGKDPKKIWNFAEKMLMAAMYRDELREGVKYTINSMTEYGVLEIVGKVVDGVVQIGTMYIKDVPK